MHHSMTPTYILYYANLDLVNVVSAGSSFITIKLNAFESVVFTNIFYMKILQKFKQTPTSENTKAISETIIGV